MATEGVLEQQRKLHEERERLEDALVKERILKKPTVKDQINCEFRMHGLVERSIDCAERLLTLYEDKDGMRKDEIAALSGPDEFGEFYRRLKTLKDFHRRHPNEVEEPMAMEFLRLDKQRTHPPDHMQTLVDFTDEEGYGKYLDMHALHETFINLRHMEKVGYLAYLSTFDKLFEVPKEKKTADYKRYLGELLEYLSCYLERVHPLLDQVAMTNEVQRNFREKWNQSNFPGWRKDTGSAMAKHSGAHLDLSAFSSPEELMSLGLDRLKSALMALGLKCGGTLEQRAKRLFMTKGVPLGALDPSHFARTKSAAQEAEGHREIAQMEAMVYKYSELLSEQRAATIENVERKMAMTADELAEESSESEGEGPGAESSDEDEGVPYNPKNLPLGWDGKPIPYWLYKLHGLNVSYSCEICGNATYRGPKAFQRHFSEWRHAHGMRCLGIPNTAHFANITAIADAIALWDKIKLVKSQDRWLATNEEEYEDRDGNVFNRKTFEDLKRQGLL